MKFALTLALASLAVLPACKGSRRDPDSYEQMQKRAPDAKPTLYVSQGDKRYVESGTGSRQIHYYSRSKDRTFVVDENTGKVVRTFATKEMPGVAVVEPRRAERPSEPTFEPPAEGCAPAGWAPEGCAPEGCGPEGCAPEGCAPEGCAPEGCGAAEDEEGEDGDETGDEDGERGDA